jgi:hypothetical protein
MRYQSFLSLLKQRQRKDHVRKQRKTKQQQQKKNPAASYKPNRNLTRNQLYWHLPWTSASATVRK